ncbi:type I-C CRISPR-associated protein Cas7/Csd2 [Rubrivirga sp.]|uniref:type I-C CRISPR-associated protein Cas7/Csd2 n=1 Tax=Rubrivirga sp. TaxID=1885344 RepID=UPI003B52D484
MSDTLLASTITDPTKRHDFVFLFDVTNGNPNGDPDADNTPRFDPETRHGLVTDVCIKRKVRDYLHQMEDANIFIQSDLSLNARIEEQVDKIRKSGGKVEKKKGKSFPFNPNLQEGMNHAYLDIRLFGAVLSTGDYNAGQVRGPLQLTFSRSVDPILPLSVTITRQARTTDKRTETGTTEIGRKAIVPYALYRGTGFFSPHLAEAVGLSRDDLGLFWLAMSRMFDYDRSAARGEMVLREAYVFTHDNPRGNAPAHKLLDLVRPSKVGAPREYSEYAPIEIEEANLLSGVTLTKLTDVAWG